MAHNVTSQWDDAHRRLGNYSELPKEKPQEEYTNEALDVVEDYDPLEDKDLDELDELEDEFEDDFMRQYREKRLAELQVKKQAPKFSGVREITRQDYVIQVTNAPKDVWVVLHLYQTYIEKCLILNNLFKLAAKKYPHIKFLKIVADKCIESYPDKNVPTLIIYRNGKMHKTLVRIDKEYPKLTIFSLEDILGKQGLIEVKDDSHKKQIFQLKDYAYGKKKKKRNDSFSSDEEDRDDRGFASNKVAFKYI